MISIFSQDRLRDTGFTVTDTTEKKKKIRQNKGSHFQVTEHRVTTDSIS